MNKYLKAGFLFPFLSIMAFFIYWLLRYYISHDLVWDELVSLKNFVFVDLITTVTHYPDVNNHLLFNLINNLYSKLININDIYEAMDSVVLMRIYPLIITLLSIIFVFKVSSKFFSTTAGFMSVIILITTIPFLNFTMQLRGYTMGMAFMAMIIYYLWSFERKNHWFYAVLSVFSVFGMLYAVPSNIYFVLAVGLVYFTKWILKSLDEAKNPESKSFIENWIKQANFYVMLLIGLGAVLAFLSYLPILDDLLNERHLQKLKGQSFYVHTLKNVIPFVLHYILSYRFLLLIPVITILTLIYKNTRKKKWNEEDMRFAFLLMIVLTSFAISLFRGDKPHQRTFTPLAIVFSIFLGASTQFYISRIKWLKGKDLLSYFLVFTYCIATFFFSQSLIQSNLHKDIFNGKKVYNMFYNFYQSDEYGMHNLDVLIEDASKSGYPIILAKEIDRVAEGEYLQKNNLAYYSTVWAKQVQADNDVGYEYQVLIESSRGKGVPAGYNRIPYPPKVSREEALFAPLFSFLYQRNIIDQNEPACYVVTYSPRWLERVLKSTMPSMKYKRLNKKLSYHNVYLVYLK